MQNGPPWQILRLGNARLTSPSTVAYGASFFQAALKPASIANRLKSGQEDSINRKRCCLLRAGTAIPMVGSGHIGSGASEVSMKTKAATHASIPHKSWKGVLSASVFRRRVGLLLFAAASFLAAPAAAQNDLISINATGTAAGNGNSGIVLGTMGPRASADGRFVVFESNANDLISGGTTLGRVNVYLRDRLNGVTTLISRNTGGTLDGNGDSFSPTITPHGRYIVFLSNARDLVTLFDVNGSLLDVFRYDTCFGAAVGCTPATELVSVNSAATGSGNNRVSIGNFEVNPHPLRAFVVSDDGNRILFASRATDLVAGFVDGNASSGADLYVRDMSLGQTFLITPNAAGTAGSNGRHGSYDMDPTGTAFAFHSSSTDLTGQADTTVIDIYFRNLSGMTLGPATNLTAGLNDTTTVVGLGVGSPGSFFVIGHTFATNHGLPEANGNNPDLILINTQPLQRTIITSKFDGSATANAGTTGIEKLVLTAGTSYLLGFTTTATDIFNLPLPPGVAEGYLALIVDGSPAGPVQLSSTASDGSPANADVVEQTPFVFPNTNVAAAVIGTRATNLTGDIVNGTKVQLFLEKLFVGGGNPVLLTQGPNGPGDGDASNAFVSLDGATGTLSVTHVNNSTNLTLFPNSSGLAQVYATTVALPTLSINGVFMEEGNFGTTDFVFTVTLSEASEQDVKVDFRTEDDSAKALDDYNPVLGTLTIPAGETSATITVPAIGDTLYEGQGGEVFFLRLSNPVGATLLDAFDGAFIIDDDPPPTVNFTPPTQSVPETAGSAEGRLELNTQSGVDAMLAVSTQDGTAVAGVDYGPLSNFGVVISAGNTFATFPITILNNPAAQGDRNFFLNIVSAQDATIGAGQAEVIIQKIAPDLSIMKTAATSPFTPAFIVGEPGFYDIVVSNNGSGPTTGVITVTDTLPAGLTFVSHSGSGWMCTASGQMITCTHAGPVAPGTDLPTLVLTVGVDAAAVPSVTNTASVSTAGDTNAANDASQPVFTFVQQPEVDLGVTVAESMDPIALGDTVTYTWLVNNFSPFAGTNVVLKLTFPIGTTVMTNTNDGTCMPPVPGILDIDIFCDLNLGANGSATVATSATPGTTGTHTVTGTVTANETDPNGNNNNVTESTVVSMLSADVSVAVADAPDPAAAGGNVAYTAVVSNAGPSIATGVSLDITMPALTTFVSVMTTQGTCSQPIVLQLNCAIGTLAPGASATVTVVVTPTVTGMFTLDADVTSGVPDPDPLNNHDSETTTANPSADVSVTKTNSPDPVNPGADLTSTIVVTNNGPSPASGVTVVDTLPFGALFSSAVTTQGVCAGPAPAGFDVTCNLGAIPSGGMATITVVTNIQGALAGTLTNTVTVTATEADPNAANNTASATTNIAAIADLSITKTDSPDPVNAGSNLTYTITVTNNGPAMATNVSISDTLPLTGLTFVSAMLSPSGPCQFASGVVTCTIGVMTSGATATATVVVTPTASGTLSNTATVTSNVPDHVPGNESATTSTLVNAPPLSSISIGASPMAQTVMPGQAANFALTIGAMPAGAVFNSPIMFTGTANPPGATITFSPNPAPPGSSAATTTMTVMLPAGSAMLPGAPLPHLPGLVLVWLALALATAGAMASRRPERRLAYCLPVGLLFLLLTLGGCMQSSAVGPVTITASATSGNVSQSVTVTVDVVR